MHVFDFIFYFQLFYSIFIWFYNFVTDKMLENANMLTYASIN